MSGESAFTLFFFKKKKPTTTVLSVCRVLEQILSQSLKVYLLEINLQIQHFPATTCRYWHFVPEVWIGSTEWEELPSLCAEFFLIPLTPNLCFQSLMNYKRTVAGSAMIAYHAENRCI